MTLLSRSSLCRSRHAAAAAFASVWLSAAHAGAEAAAVEAAAAEAASSDDQPDPVLVRPFFQVIYAAVNFETDDLTLEIVPNPTSNLGVTLGAWGFSVSLSTDVGRVEPVDDFGNSDNFNFELSYPFRVFGGRELDVTAFLHYHKTLSMHREGLPRQVVTDAVITVVGLDISLVFDPKFSIADAFSDFNPRSGSRGSFFARSTLDLWFLGYLEDPDRRLIPGELSAGLGELGDVSRLDQASATLGAGYAYDWNITHAFFLSALGNLSLAGSLLDLSFAARDQESTRALGFSLGLQLAATYVSKSFHAGLASNAVAESVNTHRVNVIGRRVSSMLFAGMRF